MDGISVIINTFNEEKHLETAIRSVKAFATEIVVVDMHSTDKTVEIAKKHKAQVFFHKHMGYVEPARNFAIEKASCEWILILDADEEIPSSLAKHLVEIVESPEAQYYRVPRKNLIFNAWIEHTGWWPDYNIRFFKKGYVSWGDEIHSVPITQGKGADLPAEEKYAIIHNNYASIDEYLARMNRYTTIQSDALVAAGYKFMWTDLMRKPSQEFVRRFFASRGYQDGVHGLALASLQAASELVLYLKVWQATKFEKHSISLLRLNEEIAKNRKEVNYWKADAQVVSRGSLVDRLKRKWKLP